MYTLIENIYMRSMINRIYIENRYKSDNPLVLSSNDFISFEELRFQEQCKHSQLPKEKLLMYTSLR